MFDHLFHTFNIFLEQLLKMELELDLKITKNIDNLHLTDLRIAKHRAGPIFVSRETETKFILTAHLKGYRREDIKIDINEDGTLISISGEKVVQEMEMKEWVMHKKEPNFKGFIKVFKIPRGVLLDRIKAAYNEDETTLTIYMPKENKGVMIGGSIEEVKNEKVSEDVKNIDHVEEIWHERDGEKEIKRVVSRSRSEIEEEQTEGEECSSIKDEGDKKEEEILEEKLDDGCQAKQGEKGDKEVRSYDQHELEEKANNKCKLFGPCLFIGSTLVASLVMLLARLFKSKRQ